MKRRGKTKDMICVVFAVKEASVRTKVQKAQHESQERCPTNVIYSENLLHDKLSRTAGACNLGAISGIPAHIKQEFFFFIYYSALSLIGIAYICTEYKKKEERNFSELSFVKVLPGGICSARCKHFSHIPGF